MSKRLSKQYSFAGTAFMAIAALSAFAVIASSNVIAGVLDQTGCPCIVCPSCKHQCKLEAKKVQAEKKGFDVEQKVICIPRVVFPWQKTKVKSCGCDSGSSCFKCANNGARTRKICVLKPTKYKCPKCEYKWSTVEKCNGGCDSSCSSAGTACAAVKVQAEPQREVTTVTHTEPMGQNTSLLELDYFKPAE